MRMLFNEQGLYLAIWRGLQQREKDGNEDEKGREGEGRCRVVLDGFQGILVQEGVVVEAHIIGKVGILKERLGDGERDLLCGGFKVKLLRIGDGVDWNVNRHKLELVNVSFSESNDDKRDKQNEYNLYHLLGFSLYFFLFGFC